MSEVLLEALAALYHGADTEAKRRASQWLEDWRLKGEAWSVADSVLHSPMTNVEVLLFCAQTLVVKIQQDFEELSPEDLLKLRESLIRLLLKFGQDPNHVVVRTQIALAVAAYCAHAHGSFWHPKTCIQWLVGRLTEELNANSFSCLIELLVVIPEEATNRRIGLHPTRRNQYKQELRDEFLTVLEVLESFPNLVTADQSLRVLGNWFGFCHIQVFQSILPRLVPFMHLAVEALQKADSNFTPAVNSVTELMYLTQYDAAVSIPEVKEFLEYLANSVLQLLPKFQELCQEEGELEVPTGLARLFCELAMEHEELIFAKTQTSVVLLEAILSVTSHPDYDVHAFAFEFWEKFSFTVKEASEIEYYSETFKKLIPLLLNQAKLSEDYLEMTEEEKSEIDRRAIWDAFMDTVSVLGPDEFLMALINGLIEQNNKPDPGHHWQEIEALLFAIRSVNGRCKSSRERLVGPLFNSLGTVPDLPVLQSAMLRCLKDYARWLPTLAHLSRSDPLFQLLPVIFRNLSSKDSAPAAVKAFCGVCESCTSYLETYIPQLEQLYGEIILAANVSHKWTVQTAPSITLTEDEALDILSAMVNGVSCLENEQTVAPFLKKITEDLMQSIRTTGQLSVTTIEFQEKMTIQTARLKNFFRSCKSAQFSSQTLKGVLSVLLPIADQASFSSGVIEEVCGCLREAVKSSGELCGAEVETLTISLPPLFAKSHHCGYLYVSSEIAKIFGKMDDLKGRVNRFVVDLLMLVCSRLKHPQNFHNDPDLADDAFLMARRVVNYCSDAIFDDEMVLMQILDCSIKGILVHHENACCSILNFIGSVVSHHHPANPDFIKNALTLSNRGLLIIKIFLAGAAGALTSKVLDQLSDALYAISSWSEKWKLGWLSGSVNLIPEQILSSTEKKNFVDDFRTAIEKESKRSFNRVVEDLSVICCRSRVTRLASQRALLPEELHYAAR